MQKYSDLINLDFPSRKGNLSPEELQLRANLREFAQRVNYISYLETKGKISSKVAYDKIKAFWNQLEQFKKQLEIDANPARDREDVRTSKQESRETLAVGATRR